MQTKINKSKPKVRRQITIRPNTDKPWCDHFEGAEWLNDFYVDGEWVGTVFAGSRANAEWNVREQERMWSMNKDILIG